MFQSDNSGIVVIQKYEREKQEHPVQHVSIKRRNMIDCMHILYTHKINAARVAGQALYTRFNESVYFCGGGALICDCDVC
jgi:hypothetical protein